MAVTDDDSTIREQQGAFCTSCGEPVGSGRFCGSCGAPAPLRMATADNSTLAGNSTRMSAPPLTSNSTGPATMPFTGVPQVNGSTPPPPPPPGPPPVATPPAKPSRSPRMVLIALGALGLVAVAVAVVILTTKDNKSTNGHRQSAGTSAATVYRTKLRSALSPLVAANQRLSSSLSSINPSQSNVASAERAASAAQTALATTRGAVGAITAPGSAKTLSQQVQQALDNENGYVGAVSATLVNPHSSQATQLQTLSTSLQSSLVPIESVATGASTSVSGTGSLSSWANGAGARAAKRAKAAHHHSSSGASGGSGSTASSGSSSSASTNASSGGYNPYANGEYCGNGVYAGPDTSCPFADNVYSAWEDQPSENAVVEAYSPVTGLNYSMNCQQVSDGITCTGGDNASVSW